MTAIRTGSVLTDSWNLMYDILSASVTDTSSDSRAGSDFIFSAYPHKTTVNRSKWTGYPFIVLTCDIGYVENLSLGKFKNDEINFKAQIYNKSQAAADRMANQIEYLLYQSETGLQGSGLFAYKLDGTDTADTTDYTGAMVHLKTLNWRYQYNI